MNSQIEIAIREVHTGSQLLKTYCLHSGTRFSLDRFAGVQSAFLFHACQEGALCGLALVVYQVDGQAMLFPPTTFAKQNQEEVYVALLDSVSMHADEQMCWLVQSLLVDRREAEWIASHDGYDRIGEFDLMVLSLADQTLSESDNSALVPALSVQAFTPDCVF